MIRRRTAAPFAPASACRRLRAPHRAPAAPSPPSQRQASTRKKNTCRKGLVTQRRQKVRFVFSPAVNAARRARASPARRVYRTVPVRGARCPAAQTREGSCRGGFAWPGPGECTRSPSGPPCSAPPGTPVTDTCTAPVVRCPAAFVQESRPDKRTSTYAIITTMHHLTLRFAPYRTRTCLRSAKNCLRQHRQKV